MSATQHTPDSDGVSDDLKEPADVHVASYFKFRRFEYECVQ